MGPGERQVETTTENIEVAVGIRSVLLACALAAGTLVETTVLDELHFSTAVPSLCQCRSKVTHV
jgi:hypothetical protein